MQYLFWDDHFDVGYDLFNEQHKEIFRLQNRVVNLLCGDAGPHELSPVLNGLIRYCESHFREEEALMEQYGYADLADHREQHERLVMRIFALAEGLDTENFNRERLLDFLNTWITGHIMKTDKRYRRFFLEKPELQEQKVKKKARRETGTAMGDDPAKAAEIQEHSENKSDP